MTTNATASDPGQVARQRMVESQLRARGISNPRVLAAMAQVPREQFVPVALLAAAYEDRALPLDCGQTISQPFMVAYMTQLLDVAPGSKVLEVGTGSGYQAAILARLARVVHTIERLAALSAQAERTLRSLGTTNVDYHVGDGSLGLPQEVPFDRIMVTAGAPSIPPRLVEQLADGGRLVIPVGKADEQTVVLVVREGTRTIEARMLGCRFVPLIGNQGWRLETKDQPSPSPS